ncbi:MAG: hypothetical protein ACPGVD_10755, partial [Flavobacteriales bacterium]
MKSPLILIIFTWMSFLALGQNVMLMHSNNSTLVTFYDKVNLREAPSTDSKILASLDEGIRIQQVYTTVKDTIN